ncbi:hypothetical protein C5749_15180 [Sphingobacterium gobiense]|uniref:Lipoprotein n=2 Tax=Sphingobacterium gobiense TaxID=1382456 RepID=A0A2S9JHX0_9SPHI|nr:hypothetical protein C5749_15180 [Sphingobacterium gobiense]
MNAYFIKRDKMKYIALIFVSFMLFSCQGSARKEASNDSSSSLPPIGGAKDKYGCLIAAGYTWSKIKDECIRPWEGTITMNITDTSTNFETAAFVLMDLTKQKAELFIQEEDDSVLLDSVTPHLYANEHYKLIEENHCWSLIHQEETLYEEKK